MYDRFMTPNAIGVIITTMVTQKFCCKKEKIICTGCGRHIEKDESLNVCCSYAPEICLLLITFLFTSLRKTADNSCRTQCSHYILG